MTRQTESPLADALAQCATVGDALAFGEQALADAEVFLGHGTDSHHDEAVMLLLHALSLPWDVDPAVANEPLSEDARQRFAGLLAQRIDARMPAPYLTHQAWFCGLPFYVDERVLIPRSPIAELIEVGFAPWVDPDRVTRVLDLCTGGGCIAIACAHAFPEAEIDASDIDADALAVCQRNIDDYGLNARVHARQGDGLAAARGRYDIIVSNPPYVDAEDMASLPPEYRHEPEHALASGDDGLDFTRQLLRQAADYLTDDGILVVEVGNSMDAVEQVWPQVQFVWLEFERGGHGVFLLTRSQLLEYFSG